VCHCLDCQRRSGSAFASQARWPEEHVAVKGETEFWSRTGESGTTATFHFCPRCGATLYYVSDGMPGLIAIPVGALAGSPLPQPDYSVFENRRRPWVQITGEGTAHYD
jgi:hypothetical protein